MTLPTMLPHDRATHGAWCRAVDEGPWASLAVPERVTYQSHDMMVQLAAAAVLTERVQLATTIIVLPAHDAVDTAKKLASVDVLAEGRLTVGVGVGGRDHDYRALGASFDHRWATMDKQVAKMKSVWAGEPPFEGADPVGPTPVQSGGPSLMAGVMGPKATARAAKWASGIDGGWTIFGDTTGLAETIETAKGWWADAGGGTPRISTSIWFALGDDAAERLSAYAASYMAIFGEGMESFARDAVTASTPDALAQIAADCQSAGVDELYLVPTTADVAEVERAAEALK